MPLRDRAAGPVISNVRFWRFSDIGELVLLRPPKRTYRPGAMKKLLQVCVEELRCAGPGRVRQFLVVTRKVWEREIMVAGIPVDLHRLARLSHRFLEPFNIGLADV